MPGPYPLPTLGPILDVNGITMPVFEDMLASFQQIMRNIYGSDIYLEPDSQDGQLLASVSQAIYDLDQAIIAAYFAYSPTFATGIGLSSQVKLNGLQRQVPTQSTVMLDIVGQAGTRIPQGAVADAFGNIWDLPFDLTIPVEGQISVMATAREAGQVLAVANSINRIVTQVPGWQTVNNPASAQLGNPIETDARLRRRQARSTGLPAITPIGGIYGALANLPGVGRVEIYENDRDYIDANGIPGHSIACVMEGGNAQEIANVIALKKNPGCGTYGSTSVYVQDSAAQPNTINFFYVTEVRIFVTVIIRPLLGYVASTADLIRQVVAQFITEMRHGWVVYRDWLFVPASLAGDIATEVTGLTQFALHRLAETFVVDDILLGTAPNTLDRVDIAIHFAEASYARAADIGVTVL
jgi:uncharacterized phage protein gp47/JayE